MEARRCIFCGKSVGIDNLFCSRKCSTAALDRALWIRRASKDAQLYFKMYQFEMERLTWLNDEN